MGSIQLRVHTTYSQRSIKRRMWGSLLTSHMEDFYGRTSGRLQYPKKINYLFGEHAKVYCLQISLYIYRKKALNYFSCGVCEDDLESIVHVLVDCFAQEVQGFSSLASVLNWPTFHNFEDFVLHGLQVLSFPNIELLFTVAWRIWLARNIRIWENQLTPARDICTHAGSLVSEFFDQIQKLPAQPLLALWLMTFARFLPPSQMFIFILFHLHVIWLDHVWLRKPWIGVCPNFLFTTVQADLL